MSKPCNSLPIEIFKGDVSSFNVTIKVDDVAVDITGYTFDFIVKYYGADFVDDNGDLITGDAVIYEQVTSFDDPTNGIATIALDKTDTAIDADQYKFRLYMTTDSNERTLLLENSLLIKE